jgi:hypothetical protein
MARTYFAAIRARHTFGTSGAKMSLLFRCGDALMGDVVPPDTAGSRTFTVDAVCQRPVRQLTILRNNEIVFETEPGREEVHVEWQDPEPGRGDTLWYYARMTTGDDEWAWSSPTWFLEREATT